MQNIQRNMVSREHERAAALHDNLQLLRAITNSHALNDTSIILDASRYIGELKHKVERLNQDIATSQASIDPEPSPTVTVETVEKGFVINAFSEKSCPEMLVTVLQAFEELGLNVLEARVSCTDRFQLQAIGGDQNGEGDGIDARVVKHTVLQAIKNWTGDDDE